MYPLHKRRKLYKARHRYFNMLINTGWNRAWVYLHYYILLFISHRSFCLYSGVLVLFGYNFHIMFAILEKTNFIVIQLRRENMLINKYSILSIKQRKYKKDLTKLHCCVLFVVCFVGPFTPLHIIDYALCEYLIFSHVSSCTVR